MSLDELRRQQIRRERLARLVLACAVTLALVGLGRTALDDVAIAGATSDQSFDEWYAQPENRFHYWYSSDERNASYFHIRQHFGDGARGDRAVRVADCESELDPHAHNPSGASGVFQVMPEWAAEYAAVTGHPYYDDRFNPNANAAFAAWLQLQEGWSQWVCAR